jgi:hypothetical protein
MARAPSPARAGTVPITTHLPKHVRDRLTIMAVALNRTMNDLIAEALDDLFARHSDQPRPPLEICILSADCIQLQA